MPEGDSVPDTLVVAATRTTACPSDENRGLRSRSCPRLLSVVKQSEETALGAGKQGEDPAEGAVASNKKAEVDDPFHGEDDVPRDRDLVNWIWTFKFKFRRQADRERRLGSRDHRKFKLWRDDEFASRVHELGVDLN